MRLLVLFLILCTPAYALAPEERLADPGLEQRARQLSRELRCVVCQNQSIDDSDAQIAADLRRVVRERLVAGESDTAIVEHLVARYGDYVLMRPRWTAGTAFLWTAPLLLLAVAALLLWRRRSSPEQVSPLTAAEARRLNELR